MISISPILASSWRSTVYSTISSFFTANTTSLLSSDRHNSLCAARVAGARWRKIGMWCVWTSAQGSVQNSWGKGRHIQYIVHDLHLNMCPDIGQQSTIYYINYVFARWAEWLLKHNSISSLHLCNCTNTVDVELVKTRGPPCSIQLSKRFVTLNRCTIATNDIQLLRKWACSVIFIFVSQR